MFTRLTLKKQSGLHYIAYQEDLMHPDVRWTCFTTVLFDADPIILGRSWSLLAAAQDGDFFGACLDGYPHWDAFHGHATPWHIRCSEGSRGRSEGSPSAQEGQQKRKSWYVPNTFTESRPRLNVRLGESGRMEDSTSGMRTEMENLDATSAKILHGNGKRSERVGDDTSRKMSQN